MQICYGAALGGPGSKGSEGSACLWQAGSKGVVAARAANIKRTPLRGSAAAGSIHNSPLNRPALWAEPETPRADRPGGGLNPGAEGASTLLFIRNTASRRVVFINK